MMITQGSCVMLAGMQISTQGYLISLKYQFRRSASWTAMLSG